MKTRLYLDTTIPSAYFDNSKPIRQLITQKWFENDAVNFELYISVITVDEIDRLSNIEKRNNIKDIILRNNVKVLELDKNAEELAGLYIKNGAIPDGEYEDALHIAIASVNSVDALTSWNFKHIVSINPIKKIHEINIKNDYIIIEIGSLELFGGNKYGNI
jgi:predicted nucleic acid-binding protein